MPNIENTPDNNQQTALDRVKAKMAIIAERENILDQHEQLVAFAKYLQNKYPNARDYLLFHTLIGSTPRPGHGNALVDFPGEDSIEKFVLENF